MSFVASAFRRKICARSENCRLKPEAATLLVWLTLAAALPLGVSAQETRLPASPFIGRPITDVAVLIENAPSPDETLLNAVQTRRGQPLAMADVRETIAHLFSLGRFEDVQVDAEAAPDGGVHLTYRLTPLHNVAEVQFRGKLELSDDLLRERMIQRFGATPPVGRAAEVARALADLYRENGYLRPSITAGRFEKHEPHETILTFDVVPGPLARIGDVQIEGNPLTSRADLINRLTLAPGSSYRRQSLDKRLQDYLDRLRHRGYYEANGALQPQVSRDGTRVDVTVHIDPGPLVTVQFDGDPLAKEKQTELVPVEREGSVDEDLLEDSTHRIEEYLRQQGYWKAQAPFERREQDGRLTVVFHVHKGSQYRVSAAGVSISGNVSIPIDELRLQTPTRLTPGELFVNARLDAETAAIRRLYRERGFAQAKIDSAVNEIAPGTVQPAITIAEGPRTVIDHVTITGNKVIPTNELLAGGPLLTKAGRPYFAPAAVQDRERLRTEYLNRGYEAVDVQLAPAFSNDGTKADVTFAIAEGPQTIVDHILVVGNTRTNPEIIRRELRIREGQPLGLEDMVDSRRRLSALGLFRRVQITPLLRTPVDRRDVVVSVEEALRTSVSYGGGAEVNKLLEPTGPERQAESHYEVAPRGFFEVDRRNVGGKNRTVGLSTRLSLLPRNPSVDEPDRGGIFPEYRVVGTFREPRIYGVNTDLDITAAIEQAARTSFNFTRKGVNATLNHRHSATIQENVRYSFSTTHVFDEQLTEQEQVNIDRFLPRVRLSAFGGGLARDVRDDVLEPHSGTLLAASGELAARAIGSQVGLTKVFLQGFWYRGFGPRQMVFATGARLGLATGFPREVQLTNPDGTVIATTVREVPASERFFAGGSTTIRGYAQDSVGEPDTISAHGFPIGGNAMIVLNAELRVPVWRGLAGAVFLDGGNVYARASDLSLGDMRGGAGFGVRYKSPVGPIRVDWGFKLDRRVIAGTLEPRSQLHISIGQAV
jgi:outer membrane protein insertion porin family